MTDELWNKGLEIRREVVGADHVERSLAASDDFNMPLQEYITKYAWGDIWRRPGLDRRSRSILNIGMLTALNRPAELKLHLRGALRNGVSREEIRECLLQSAVYCGAPAALDAFRVAREMFAEIEAEPPGQGG
ncbi:MAG: 4-carboxymuconolactone decarboxylase [Proteobacteria bacterium]|nr:4-carboxymuconolactone decarboxylase [Pseudomonadota bacterium]